MNLQPNELRLGILVYDSLRQKNTTIQLKHFRELAISDKTFFDRYKAVEISEEILLEIGSSKHGNEWSIGSKGYIECFEYHNNELYYTAGEGISLSRPIKQLHQLQNLFHSLTGEDLIC